MSALQPTLYGHGFKGERRKHSRIKVPGNHLVLGAMDRRADVLLLDVSLGGLGVHSDESVPLGIPLSVSMELPGEPKIVQVTVAAVFSSNGRTGLRIVDIDGRSSNILRRWMSAQEQMPQPATLGSPPETAAQHPPIEDGEVGGPLRSSISDQELEQMLTDAAKTLSASSGAIAWKYGEVMTCRVARGNAPAVGVRLDTNRGLSAECYRKASIACCEDTETDVRVNRDVCREGGIRSVLVAPLVSGAEIVGLLHLFFSQPRSFGPTDFRTLNGVLGDLAVKGDALPIPGEPDDARYSIDNSPAAKTLDLADQSVATRSVEFSLPMDQAQIESTKKQALIVASTVLLVAVGIFCVWFFGMRPSSVSPPPPLQAVSGTPAGTSDAAPPTDATQLLSGTLRPVSTVYPSYPKEAWSSGIGGTVLLNVTVRPDGRVRHVEVIQGQRELALAAVEAVEQWRYERASERNADRQTEVKINFKPQTAN